MPSNWVSEMERRRFPKSERDKADELFRAIGMDPDIYMPYARAQVVRVKPTVNTTNHVDNNRASNHLHDDQSQAS